MHVCKYNEIVQKIVFTWESTVPSPAALWQCYLHSALPIGWQLIKSRTAIMQ